jgi:ligand-binding sensor domain-containing protein/signal transduction histidine kinase
VRVSSPTSDGNRVKWWTALLVASAAFANGGTPQRTQPRGDVIRVPIVRGTDIRFQKLPNPQNLSQVRVGSIVQDGQGFLWFGTWNGLNRYDGYKIKVFKHEAGNNASLSGTHVYSLFRDRSGNLWVGTDQFLDRFEPLTETFRHYRLDERGDQNSPGAITHISQDSRGFLWLSTRNGLFRLDPETGRMKNYRHSTGDPHSLGDNDIKSTGEDRSGSFWVGTSRTLDEFDRENGRVKRRILIGESGIGLWFHEDRERVFWVIYGSSGRIATLDRNSGKFIPYEYEWTAGSARPNQAYAMLEDQDGTMWFGTAGAGLMRFDRTGNRFISYEQDPADGDSIGHNRVIALFEDREANIWIGLHQGEPNFFRKKPLPFENLTRRSVCKDGEISGLISSIYQDSDDYVWLASNRRLQRINRKTGECAAVKAADDSEVLSIAEDGRDVLWLGNAPPGLLRYELRTGKRTGYSHDSVDPTTLCSGVIDHVLVDRAGTLWSATWDGLCEFDAVTQRFTRYKPDPNTRGLNYYSIAQGPDGAIWLGGNLGLHRFDSRTHTFKTWSHKVDNPGSISDNQVNAVFVDHLGRLWIGTQNGLDRLEQATGQITKYNQRNGMAGNAVSCILADARGTLWMSTNKGISSFRPETKEFANYTVADGLPGPDLTGWGSCYKSPAGEMFFAGISGATAFFPDRVEQDELVTPQTVLTDFRLFGHSVAPGVGTPLKSAINHTRALRLSHEQNVFSIEFSALTYFNPGTVRYRYKLDGLDHRWHEVGSDERLASYTTLPADSYTFHVQSAMSRGPWSPDLTLAIEVLPPWWSTRPFQAAIGALLLLMAWAAYRQRVHQVARQFEARLTERTRIARELHDTLLQSFQASLLQMQSARNLLSRRPEQAVQNLDDAIAMAAGAIVEARDEIQHLRSQPTSQRDLAQLLTVTGHELTRSHEVKEQPVTFRVLVEGERQHLEPLLQDEIYCMARELLRNAFQHAEAKQIEAEIRYEHRMLRVYVRDDGKGITPEILEAGGREGHWGLAGMRERAKTIGARLEFWSEAGAGTEVQLTVPSSIAYRGVQSGRRFKLFRRKRTIS